ncbi:MAG: hypothetical protein QG675_433 [Patescibacteria group bacterium]|jgi:hypothetical protein|nr:hypothetical protein [Patescibacteria group bacterium]
MDEENNKHNDLKNIKNSGIAVIVCGSLSIILSLFILLIAVLLIVFDDSTTSSLDAYILLAMGIVSFIVSMVDLIAGIRIYRVAKNTKGWAIYLICSGVLGGLLGYVMLGVGVYVLMQFSAKKMSNT